MSFMFLRLCLLEPKPFIVHKTIFFVSFVIILVVFLFVCRTLLHTNEYASAYVVVMCIHNVYKWTWYMNTYRSSTHFIYGIRKSIRPREKIMHIHVCMRDSHNDFRPNVRIEMYPQMVYYYAWTQTHTATAHIKKKNRHKYGHIDSQTFSWRIILGI